MQQKRLKLEEAPETPDTACLVILRSAIPADLTPAERLVLRANLNHDCDGQAFWFWDRPDVRRALRMGLA